MRQAIATAPRDGSALILEDDVSGIYDIVHWSPKAGEWVTETGEASKITPSHWYPMPANNEHGGSAAPSEASPPRRYAALWIAATFCAAGLVGMYFSSNVAAYVKQGYAGLQDSVVALQQKAEAYQAIVKEAVRVNAAVVAPAPEGRKFLDKEQGTETSDKEHGTEVLVNEPAEAQLAVRGLPAVLANSAQLPGHERGKLATFAQEPKDRQPEPSREQYRGALDEERARGVAVARELAEARREIETGASLLNKARDDAARFNQTAERMTRELQQERERAEVLVRQLETARREIALRLEPKGSVRSAATRRQVRAIVTTAPKRSLFRSIDLKNKSLAIGNSF
jgi:hypothetical protein